MKIAAAIVFGFLLGVSSGATFGAPHYVKVVSTGPTSSEFWIASNCDTCTFYTPLGASWASADCPRYTLPPGETWWHFEYPCDSLHAVSVMMVGSLDGFPYGGWYHVANADQACPLLFNAAVGECWPTEVLYECPISDVLAVEVKTWTAVKALYH